MAQQTYNNGYNKLFIDNADGEAIRALKVLEGYCLDKRGKEKDCYNTCVICHMLYSDSCPFLGDDACAPGDWEISETLYNSGLTIRTESGERFNA